MVLVCMQIFLILLLRTCGSKETYEKVCEAFRPVTNEHIDVYGELLTMKAFNWDYMKPQHVSDFSYGVSDQRCIHKNTYYNS